MKRLLPILGIFLMTTGLVSKEVKGDEVLQNMYEDFTTDLYEKTDDFDNTTTWILNIISKNKMPFYSEMAMMSPFSHRYNDLKTPAKLKLTCKWTPLKNKKGYVSVGGHELVINPSAPIVKNGNAELKFDNLPPLVQSLYDKGRGSDEFSFGYDSANLIKRLDEHSTLKIRYLTTKGTQIAEFVLDENKEISKLVKKCY